MFSFCSDSSATATRTKPTPDRGSQPRPPPSTQSADMATVFGDAGEFAQEMKQVINENQYSDITFIVGDTREKIHAHRIILAARCEVFRAMFAEQRAQAKSGKKDNVPLVLPDVRPSATNAPKEKKQSSHVNGNQLFLAVLEYIYTNSCTLKPSTVVDVLASAIEYGLDGLAACCANYITDNLTVDTACGAIQAAIAYDQIELRDRCMTFIEEHTAEVFHSKHFVEISAETFAHILESDKLRVPESTVLEVAKNWASVNAVVTGQSLKDTIAPVIEHVRLPLLDAATLQQIEADNEKDPIVPERLISKAWKYQATRKAPADDKHFVPRAGS
ncbi:uncharacterized protein MONBRDRAFT_30025 [Monosiga brevicollis MX1]|uniref:BTB domain-containing protein n=1 Tax=Monosiga brevicollis TaxID=81824 RepID=A9VCT1_MONBE|nr:uncharacterized protein MONBRDRAFT_30025 [Monosiga brevicollis MX1]EDQ84649.1 predicted protein [Monosiga brevicollis MX1]|eukprot:XP_001750553.1 hypothetical protein [Monosiga brevicollis MX1]